MIVTFYFLLLTVFALHLGQQPFALGADLDLGEALKGQGLEGTDEVTTIRRTTLRLFGVVITSSRICSRRLQSIPDNAAAIAHQLMPKAISSQLPVPKCPIKYP
jgi:hypothetical protein